MPASLRLRLSIALYALSLLLTGALRPTSAAAERNPDDFPLQVHIYTRHVHHDRRYGAYFGEGKANLVEGSQIHAIDFAYRCGFRLEDNDKGESYPARWKREGLKLQILTGVYGSPNRTQVCDLETAVKDFVFDKDHGSLVEYSQAEYATRRRAQYEHDQAMAPTDLNPANYPLEFALLHISWTGALDGIQIGSGQANLRAGQQLNAVDFSIHCPIKIQPPPEGRYLLGKWLEPGDRMLLLLRPVDVDGAPGATCQVMTTVDPDVYIRSGGSIKAISQEAYAQRSK